MENIRLEAIRYSKDMYKDLLGILPEELATVAIDLKDILGINEVVWGADKSKKTIETLSQKGYVILGGDVYKTEDNKIKNTYDNWYYDEKNDGSDIDESRAIAIEYINKYEKVNNGNYLYSIIANKQ